MQDGTNDEKLDAIMEYLFDGYKKSIAEDNLSLAFAEQFQMMQLLTEKFGDKGIFVKFFIERLEANHHIVSVVRDNIPKGNDGEMTKKYKLSPQGVDFIMNGDSYVKVSAREKEKRDLEINLLRSNLETNRISARTNRNIAVFTFIAALYYGFELIKDYFPETEPCKKEYENWTLITLFVLGILGFLKISLPKWLKNKKDRP